MAIKIAVSRVNLEINKRITLDKIDRHHPPLIVKYEDGTIVEAYEYSGKGPFRVVYDPANKWSTVVGDSNQEFVVWVEDLGT